MKNSSEQSPEKGLSLGSGTRFSAIIGLLAYGVSRLTLVVVWTLWATAGDPVSTMLRAATHFFAASTGLVSVALALVLLNSSLLTNRHIRLFGLLLVSLGVGVMIIQLAHFINLQDPASLFSHLDFLGNVAYVVLLMYLGVGLLRDRLTLGRSTFMVLALLAVASLLRSVQLDYLVLSVFDGLVDSAWLRQFLYAVSMGLAFAAFTSISRKTDFNLGTFTQIREYTLLRGSVLLYGLGEFIIFFDMYLLRFDETVSSVSAILTVPVLAVVTTLWPVFDILFALSIIAFAVSMRQLRP